MMFDELNASANMICKRDMRERKTSVRLKISTSKGDVVFVNNDNRQIGSTRGSHFTRESAAKFMLECSGV